MKLWDTTMMCLLLLLQTSNLSGQQRADKVFLLEDTQSHKWCAYDREADWNSAVQEAAAMTVGTVTYADNYPSEIDVTETDETGDWTVYDHYFLNQRGEVATLSRTINVLPGDRSVLQKFSLKDGKTELINTTQKELRTGKALHSPTKVWLPELAITKDIRLFPFFGLLQQPDLRTSAKSCIQK